mgnify:CR=1 FL=1
MLTIVITLVFRQYGGLLFVLTYYTTHLLLSVVFSVGEASFLSRKFGRSHTAYKVWMENHGVDFRRLTLMTFMTSFGQWSIFCSTLCLREIFWKQRDWKKFHLNSVPLEARVETFLQTVGCPRSDVYISDDADTSYCTGGL